MCINGGEKQDGKKSCGQAGYVIYNSSPESMLKFKQVESYEDFERIDNYEYRWVSFCLFRVKWSRQNKLRLQFWHFELGRTTTEMEIKNQSLLPLL